MEFIESNFHRDIYITVQTIVPLAYNPPSYKYISIIYIIILVLASGISLYRTLCINIPCYIYYYIILITIQRVCYREWL